MKKLILFLSIILIAFSSCDKKNEPKEPFKLDPNATINLKPDLDAWKAPMRAPAVDGQESKYLSPLEIVKQAASIAFRNDEIAVGQELLRSFGPEWSAQRDTLSNPPMLKMWGTDIISSDGGYVTEFINGRDLMLIRELDPVTYERDTIAYIPESVLAEARIKVKEAYDRGDNEEVYRLFNEAFIFKPITGAEWLALKSKNKN